MTSQRPVHIAKTVEIDESASTVWAVIADYDRDTQWRSGLIEMTPDPAGLPREGTRIHEVLRTGGRTYQPKHAINIAADTARNALGWVGADNHSHSGP